MVLKNQETQFHQNPFSNRLVIESRLTVSSDTVSEIEWIRRIKSPIQ